jgi:hypothetical protein
VEVLFLQCRVKADELEIVWFCEIFGKKLMGDNMCPCDKG